MRYLALIIPLILLQGCSTLSITENSDSGIILLSTTMTPGCEGENDYLDNGNLYFRKDSRESSGVNWIQGRIETSQGFVLKSRLLGTDLGVDFGTSGKIHSMKIEPGKYFFTQIHATPMSFVHHHSEQLDTTFTVEPGRITYLGSIEIGTIECASSREPNIGNRTIFVITDELQRDISLAKKEWPDLDYGLLKTALARYDPPNGTSTMASSDPQPQKKQSAIATSQSPADMDQPAVEQIYSQPMEPSPQMETAPVVTNETQYSGDVLQMDQATGTQAAPIHQLDFPRRGMTQDKVQNELGRPIEIVPAIGQPPITRWVYDDRVVYFEYSSVVHVVAK